MLITGAALLALEENFMNLTGASDRVWEALKVTFNEYRKMLAGKKNKLPTVLFDGLCHNCGEGKCRFNSTLDSRLPTEKNPNGFQLRTLGCNDYMPIRRRSK